MPGSTDAEPRDDDDADALTFGVVTTGLSGSGTAGMPDGATVLLRNDRCCAMVAATAMPPEERTRTSWSVPLRNASIAEVRWGQEIASWHWSSVGWQNGAGHWWR